MEYRTAARKVASPSHRPFRATDNDPFVVVCTAIAEHCDVAPVLGKIERDEPGLLENWVMDRGRDKTLPDDLPTAALMFLSYVDSDKWGEEA